MELDPAQPANHHGIGCVAAASKSSYRVNSNPPGRRRDAYADDAAALTEWQKLLPVSPATLHAQSNAHAVKGMRLVPSSRTSPPCRTWASASQQRQSRVDERIAEKRQLAPAA
jgi:hypothetical protein